MTKMENINVEGLAENFQPELMEVKSDLPQSQLPNSDQVKNDNLNSEEDKEKTTVSATKSSKANYVSSKSKKKLKIIVRQLPPTLDEEEFFDLVKEWVNDETVSVKYYVQGKIPKNPSKKTQVSRAYIAFRNETNLIDFFNVFNGTVLSDLKNSKYLSLIEYAPFQAVPVESPVDKKEATIEEDSHYIRFIEGKDDPQPKESKKSRKDKKAEKKAADKKTGEKKDKARDKDDKKKKKKNKKNEKVKSESTEVQGVNNDSSKPVRTRSEKKSKSKAAKDGSGKEANGDKKSANKNKKAIAPTEKVVLVKRTESTPSGAVSASSFSTLKSSLPMSLNAQPFVPSSTPVFEPANGSSEIGSKPKSNKKSNSTRKKKPVKQDEAKSSSTDPSNTDSNKLNRPKKPAKKKDPANTPAAGSSDKPASTTAQQTDKPPARNRRRNNKPKDGAKKSNQTSTES